MLRRKNDSPNAKLKIGHYSEWIILLNDVRPKVQYAKRTLGRMDDIPIGRMEEKTR